MFRKLTAVLIFATIAQCSVGTEALAQEGITVSGKASVEQPVTRFSLSLEITEFGFSASKTKALVDQKSAQVTRVLQSHGVANQDINSAQLRLTTVNNKREIERLYVERELAATESGSDRAFVALNKSRDSKTNNKQILFRVSRTIRFSFNDIDVYDRLLDGLVKSGVTQLSPLVSGVENAEQLYQQALALAIDKARAKAEFIAKQAGVSLGEVISLQELGYHVPKAKAFAMAESAGFQSQHGNSEVNAEVSVVFAIK